MNAWLVVCRQQWVHRDRIAEQLPDRRHGRALDHRGCDGARHLIWAYRKAGGWSGRRCKCRRDSTQLLRFLLQASDLLLFRGRPDTSCESSWRVTRCAQERLGGRRPLLRHHACKSINAPLSRGGCAQTAPSMDIRHELHAARGVCPGPARLVSAHASSAASCTVRTFPCAWLVSVVAETRAVGSLPATMSGRSD